MNITGVDLSKNMIDIAKSRMKKAKFINKDFFGSLSELDLLYDTIIFNYAIHHLEYKEQVQLIKKLIPHLSKNGIIIIGDVMTESTVLMEQLAKQEGDYWDDEEFYPIVDIYKENLEELKITYHNMTFCSGVMVIKKVGN